MPEIPVYVEELGMTLQEQKKNRFRKQDPYHLPDLDISIEYVFQPLSKLYIKHPIYAL